MGRVIEIASEGYALNIERGFLVLTKKDHIPPVSKVPLDEIDVLVINSQATSLAVSVHTSLASRGVPILFCDSRHLPISLSLPISQNYEQSKRVRQQSKMTEATADKVWAQIVRSKVLRQAELLEHLGKNGLQLRRIAGKVVDGDPTNCEAEAAKVYWRALFGDDFRRGADSAVNTHLNYGYAVLRGAVARHVCANGLSPSLGVHHRNASNPMCLVDDLMEPFRPAIDFLVFTMCPLSNETITKEDKGRLVGAMAARVRIADKKVSFDSGIKSAVFSFYQVCVDPDSPLDIDWHFCAPSG